MNVSNQGTNVHNDVDQAKPSQKTHIPTSVATAVLTESSSMPEGTFICEGHDFSKSHNNLSSQLLDAIMRDMRTTGFQATNVALAVEQIKAMRSWRLSDEPYNPDLEDPSLQSVEERKKIRARIFFSYTSNQISCGQREVIRFMVQHKMVDVIVTTAGGIEEDLVKCFNPTYMGDFHLSGRQLRKEGINRIGNLLIPNKNYCSFEDWISPIIDKMHEEQDEAHISWAKAVSSLKPGEDLPDKFVWTPSKAIQRFGKEINNESSVLYWAAKNNIPIFCPALTDGSIGDMLFFHSYKKRGLILDINEDIRRINELAVNSYCTGQIIIGGGVVKHHVCNANLMRNGANYSVYINTSHEFDGSDSGASPDEAVSWGKIRLTANPVKVTADATIVWPLIVSQTFAKDVDSWIEQCKNSKCWLNE